MEPGLTERDQADLAAYADGTLPRARRRELEARLEASVALREALERQRAALASVRAVEEVPAPARLRAWLRDQDARRPAPQERAAAGPSRSPGEGAFAATLRRRRPLRSWVAAASMAAAAAAAIVVLALTGSGHGAAGELAEAATRAPSAPAPGRAGERRLAVASDGVAFPYWAPRHGWRATGWRKDTVDGREAVTVTYRRGNRTIAYAILGRPALDLPGDGGTYRSFEHEGRRAVAWIRAGRTCVLLGDGRVGDATLRRLAASVKYY